MMPYTRTHSAASVSCAWAGHRSMASHRVSELGNQEVSRKMDNSRAVISSR